ncbi:copper resistance protein CopC [Paucisalibacillus sp. EB02]|uniref:copper resistance CopC family protein n=1 Tax=Paucisalibacillus sp. EB02 TaxID=1347087 RepID=UPI0004B5C8DA|nr:copper resistance protein CopC [Paucisalibacillus sp. EB02]
MKRIFTSVIVGLLAMFISTSVFAHSHLEESNPADGDTVKEPLNEIVLEFNGPIEQGSFIDVTTTEGETVEIQEIIIDEGTLTGAFSEPLANDEYLVNWNIVSGDGHPLEGEFSFTVNAEVPESEDEVTEEPSEPETTEMEDSTESAEQSTEDQESSSMIYILIVALVIIAIVGFTLLIKRKK